VKTLFTLAILAATPVFAQNLRFAKLANLPFRETRPTSRSRRQDEPGNRIPGNYQRAVIPRLSRSQMLNPIADGTPENAGGPIDLAWIRKEGYRNLDARIWFFTDYYSFSPGMISQIPGRAPST
jgi:hypothetical protein